MKLIFTLLTAAVLYSCTNSDNSPNKKLTDSFAVIKVSNEDSTEDEQSSSTSEMKENKTGWLSPAFLTADFNNDKMDDTAFAVIVGGKKGIRIKHGGTNKEILLGAGNKFGNGGDDFKWADTWSLVNDSITYETTFDEEDAVSGTGEIRLESTAFYIGQDGAGGATIAWIKGEYVWIHQGC